MLSFKSSSLRFLFSKLLLMLIEQIADLSTVFAFKNSYKSLLRVLLLVFINRSSLLQLFKCDLKFLLRFNEILFVCFLLLLHEVALALPQRLFSIIVALYIQQLLLQLLHLCSQLHSILRMCRIPIVECSPSRTVQCMQLILQLRYLIIKRLFLTLLFRLQSFHLSL